MSLAKAACATLALATCVVAPQASRAQSASQIPGTLTVTETGASNYTIPLALPVGIKGVEPKLALSYSSQSGNGLAGVGWGLTGLSAITRCAQNRAIHGQYRSVQYDAQDRFCLDGKPLVLMTPQGIYGNPGTEYRTERDDVNRIVAYGGSTATGPSYFTVTRRDGTMLEFGGTEDSQIQVGQGGTAIRAWALNKVVDIYQNYLKVSYLEDNANGTFYPSEIWYTGNTSKAFAPQTGVKLNYATSNAQDAIPQYAAGRYVKSTLRLASIEAYSNSFTAANRLQYWSLGYDMSPTTQRSRLTSVQQCGSICLPRLNVTWDSGDGVASNSIGAANFNQQIPAWANAYGDLNNDGYLDTIGATQSYDVDGAYALGTPVNFSAYIASATGYQAVSTTVPAPPEGAAYGYIHSRTLNTQLMAYDGDGVPDIFLTSVRSSGDSSGRIMSTDTELQVYRGLGRGAFDTNRIALPAEVKDALVADYDGDGISDFVKLTENASTSSACDGMTGTQVVNGSFSLSVWNKGTGASYVKSQPSGPAISFRYQCVNAAKQHFFCKALDANGDGRADLLCKGVNTYGSAAAFVLQNNGAAYTLLATLPIVDGGQEEVGDFNGDGIDDIFQVAPGTDTQTDSVRAYLGTGSGYTEIPGWNNQTYSGWKSAGVSDVNGDGRADVLVYSQLGVFRVGYNGTGMFCQLWYSGIDPKLYSAAPGTFDGRAFSGLLVRRDDALQHFPARLQTQDRVARLFDGLRDDRVVYATLPQLVRLSGLEGYKRAVQDASAQTNTSSSGLSTQLIPVTPPVGVVDTVKQRDGLGGDRNLVFGYGAAVTELGGRGTLGLKWVEKFDSASGLTERQTFGFAAPYEGMPVAISVNNRSQLVKRREITYGCRDQIANTGAACLSPLNPNSVSLVFPSIVEDTLGDPTLNGFLSRTRTTQLLSDTDAYGNAKFLTIVSLKPDGSDSGFRREITTSYQVDTVKWMVDRKSSQSIKAIQP